MTKNVPAKRKSELLASPLSIVPAAVAYSGRKAQKRFVTFFTDNIRNPNTREAYHRNVMRFFAWCELKNLPLPDIESYHVSAYLEELLQEISKPSVKQHLASIRMLFDWLVIGQVVSINPAAAVRGPKHVVKKGVTPVLDEESAKILLEAIDTSHVVGLRDRAIIGMMIYSFARIDAVLQMNVRDYYPNGKRWFIRLHEKGGKLHEMPAHHKLDEFMDDYLDAADIRDQKNSPLFRTSRGRSRVLTNIRHHRVNAWHMIQRRAADAEISTEICNHTFRGTGITNFLENGGFREKAQQMANHESARTTGLYDRREDKITLDEIERISI